MNWDIKEKGDELIRFVTKLTKLRRDFPILRRNRFLTGTEDTELNIRDVTWINANGNQMNDEEWADEGMHCFGMMIDGRAQATGIKQRGSDVTVLLILNAHYDLVQCTLPDAADASGWKLLFDTNIPDAEKPEQFSVGATYDVTCRSFVAFELKTA